MNIWIFNHYAVTPEWPGGTRHYDLANGLTAKGHNITVFASGFNYSTLTESQNYNNSYYLFEKIDKINWCWIKTYAYKKNNLKRLINMISYSKRTKLISKELGKPDLIIGSTVHPFAALTASRIARKFKVPFIFEIRDLWPQTFIDNETWKTYHPVSIIFLVIEKLTTKRSNGFIALSPNTKKYLTTKYSIPDEAIAILPNGCMSYNPHIKEDLKKDKITTFMYLGGMDTVHQLDHLILALSKIEKSAKPFKFALVGGGKNKSHLQKMAAELNIKNIEWEDPVIKSEVPPKLSKADLLFLPTAEVQYGSENKLSEYLMAGKPILTYTPAKHNDPVNKAGCGMSAIHGNIKDLSSKIQAMVALSDNERNSMGIKGHQYASQHFDIQKLGIILNDFLMKFI